MSGFATFFNGQNPSDGPERDRAYAELLRFVRIVVRAEMGRKLRDHRESADVCQSIAKSFVDDFQAGKVAFESERALAAYLRLAVRNKLAELARYDGALKRGGDARAVDPDLLDRLPETRDAETAASWDSVREMLSDDERRLVDLRLRGLEWETIADQLGMSGAAARQRFARLRRRLQEADESSGRA